MGRKLSSCIPVLLLALFLTAGACWADGTVSGKIQDANGNPIEGAIVRVADGQERTTTDGSGMYSLRVPSGSVQILIVAQGYNSTGTTLRVSDGETETMNFALQQALSQFGERVVVLGSRSDRTALETPVPVDVLSAEDMAESGQTETARKIQFLAPWYTAHRGEKANVLAMRRGNAIHIEIITKSSHAGIDGYSYREGIDTSQVSPADCGFMGTIRSSSRIDAHWSEWTADD
jgi:hypothetical protein